MSAVAVIPRPYYLQRLNELRENALIKVILGPRRCGKSFLLEMYQTRLKESGVDEQQLIVTNLDDYDSRYLRDPAALHEYITERSNDNRMHYVFIDEIQMCRDFQEVLASLSRHRNLDIYVTGSNAFLLSGELATMLTGRYSEIRMSTLSFAEFRNACKEDGLSSDQDLLRYMQIGGFPAIIPYRNNPRAIQDYYEGLVTSIIVKDICYRLNAKDAKLLDQLALCLATSIGSVISPKNLVAAIEKTGRSISVPTLYLYLQALEDSFFFSRVGRFDIRGRAALQREEKFYLCDTGFRAAITSTPVKDAGRLLENIVYLELKRRYKKVSIGRAGEREIDFVTESANGFAYFQVAMTVMDPTTLERELAPFASIRDAYPRYLITADTFGTGRNFDGVVQVNAAQWLEQTNLKKSASPVQ